MIRRETYPRSILSEGIQILSFLTIWGSLGKKSLNERVGESNLEEWSKCVVDEKNQTFRL